jgi:2'-5' RNA ligase
MKAEGSSLWLMPTSEVYNKFASLINRLAREYDAPIFEPHVTLLGGVMQPEEDVLRKAAQTVSGKEPFPINLRVVDYQDFYFKALFVNAEKTDPLQALHGCAKELFGMQDIPNYMPHLSLMYGDFLQAVKEQIINAIGRDQATEFTVNSIHLFKTEGEANAWYKVKEIPFS